MSFQGSTGLSFTSLFGDGIKVVEHQNHIFQESGIVPCSIIESSRGSLICVPVTEGISSDGDSYLTVTEVDVPKDNYDGSLGGNVIIRSQSPASGLCMQQGQQSQLDCPGESESGILEPSGEAADSAIPPASASPLLCHQESPLLHARKKESSVKGIEPGNSQKVCRKGGWPKGKKRKKGLIEMPAPKSPATGYVLFLNKRRKQVKENRPEIPFTEVTKLLGNEWTNLPAQEKKGYLKQAEEEKSRYREELRQYQQSEAYQALSNKKKSTGSSAEDTESALREEMREKSINLPIHDIEEEGFRRELYCVVCDKLFNSLHNKREHLYGKQHLSNITGVPHQVSSAADKDLPDKTGKTQNENLVSESSNGHFHLRDSVTSVSSAMEIVTLLSIDRLKEIEYLIQRCGNLRQHKIALEKDITLLEELKKKREKNIESVRDEGKSLSAQLVNLRMVPTLFGIINF